MIDLYSRDPRIIKLVREAMAGLHLVVTDTIRYQHLPTKADYIASSASLSPALEKFAAGRGALPVILPEGHDYLAERASRTDRSLVLIGADYVRTTKRDI